MAQKMQAPEEPSVLAHVGVSPVRAEGDGDQSVDGNTPVVNPAEFLSILQTTFQQMQDRFTQMMDTVMDRMDEMSDRLNDLEKEVTDLVNYAGGIGEQQTSKDTENIPPDSGSQQ
ncbi:uncharacterized protein LOC129589023 [Paramacrobiotus metropolitanus]|uniref:uncharacterized protein LOC129589023 n=1 Tax=Paramacrobiotus metropolitanus TaxID=2943436 RepID=UPI0024459AE3|nr:uncharacterized protein LOC129589023 [Paramacrobiotus metropolitanus]XP_055339462.1 uncharacterized protein LOC129589023 [Paramacrobiotus metropolitanus]